MNAFAQVIDRGAAAICIALACCVPSLAVGAAPATRAAPPLAIDYEVRRPHELADGYEITLRFKGEASGRSMLHLPGDWASAQHAERGIRQLEVLTPDAMLEDTDDSHVKRIRHRRGAALVVRYRLFQIQDGVPDVRWSTNYLPVLQPSYFEWIGITAWVVPAAEERRVRVRVRFDDLPEAWNFASSFGLDPHAVSYLGTMNDFMEAIFVGGDFRLRSRAVRGGRLVTAIRGDWPFRDSEFADRAAVVVDGERTFWKDATQRDFLITLMPVHGGGPNARSFNGTGLRDSFATFINGLHTLEDLDFLLTHEYFHTWNARALGKIHEPEALQYWFSEGFTDYYSHLLRLRWKMLTLAQYAAEYDDVLKSLAMLPDRHLPNAEIGARFFADPRGVGKLPYWRGMLVAARWDAEIRAASGGRRSLDDAMRAMARQHAGAKAVLDTTRIARTMRDSGVTDPAGDIARWIDRGDTIDLPADSLTPCIAIDAVTEARFDPGFDANATMKSKRLTNVDPNGAAYLAGLREGDVMRSIDMHHDATRIATVGVQEGDADRERKIAFLPAGKRVERQRVRLREPLDPETSTHCLVLLGVPDK